MKKLKLNLQQFPGAEVLTRSQLKNVLGGTNIPLTQGGCLSKGCSSDSDCGGNCPKCVNVNPTYGNICATSVHG